ncbi:MAG: pseudouridine-5-phosphate glycosidase, partial [Rhodobacteraceae bacterium]|nr:pseudouridine-5-phosphate glycosidase [Paracoccaceae bacterium]
ATREAQEKGIRGKAVTPFLLGRILELTGGRSLKTNIALVRNNARVAAGIAKALVNKA